MTKGPIILNHKVSLASPKLDQNQLIYGFAFSKSKTKKMVISHFSVILIILKIQYFHKHTVFSLFQYFQAFLQCSMFVKSLICPLSINEL